MTNQKAPFGAFVMACVVVAIIRLPLVVITGIVAVLVGMLGDVDVGGRRAIGLTLLAWPLWAILLVVFERLASARRDNGTTRIDVAAIYCASTVGSLLVSSALLAGGPAGGVAYGLIVAAIVCVIDILGLTRGKPFAADWHASTVCTPRSKRAEP